MDHFAKVTKITMLTSNKKTKNKKKSFHISLFAVQLGQVIGYKI